MFVSIIRQIRCQTSIIIDHNIPLSVVMAITSQQILGIRALVCTVCELKSCDNFFLIVISLLRRFAFVIIVIHLSIIIIIATAIS